MRKSYVILLLVLSLMMTVSLGWGVITDYSFSQNLGTYTEITGGTVHGTSANDNEVFNDLSIGFDFNFNGTVYTNVSIATNGFIAMGPTVTSSNTAISTGTSNNVIAVLNRDIRSRDDGELSSLLSGTAPNRVFTMQWKNYRRYPTAAANDTLNFQIQLHETSNVVSYHYGHFFAASVTTAATVQVGMRGADNTEYINRTTTTDWTATTPGTANNSSCRMNDTVIPPDGLVFNWTPPQAGTPPNPAQIVSPLDSATNVSIAANLVWLSGGGAPTGYKVFFGTDNPPTNIVNGTLQTDTEYNPVADFTYSTIYYWQIVPTNDFGDAVGCPVWSFTSMADPTVTVYPYTQNWDDATPPTVPPSWTIINANSDNFTWVTVASGANSAPNTLRCSYNSSTAIAMDDWAISPPLQLAADTFYRIQFYYKAQSATLPEKLEVKYGTANNVAALTEQIFVNNNVTNTDYVMGEAFIPQTTAGIYYVGFHGYSDANMYYLFIDDITVSAMVPVFDPPTNLTGVFGATDVMLMWQSPTGSTPVGYNVFRNDVQINTTPITGLSYTDDSPAAGLRTYYVTAVYTNPDGESEPSNTVSGELLRPVTNLQYTVAQNNVSLTWTPPGGPILQDWIHFDDGTNYAGIGTNAAANFDVAARFTQTELSGISDRYLTKVRYYPNEANCIYTIKVWTGGTSPTNPGTLAATVPVTAPVIGEWNIVDLPVPIQIPSTGELWVGYNVNTQAGHPAGCDNGPSIPYKGNMIYIDNEWTILTELGATLDYNWNIQAFVVNFVGKESPLVHIPETIIPGNITVEVSEDGGGINTSKVIAKAKAKGLVAADAELTDAQIHDLIFLPGFSTADQATDVSGRGVGMDVVRRNIEELGGSVEVRSEVGKGSRFIINLPLTLAIVD
ncbi:MAG: ATP-binding protein, partial [Candidatus Cloacimonadaceae bacterium]